MSNLLILASPLDPGYAALLGALIGGGASVIVQIIAAIVTAKHEKRAFGRTLRKETIASVADAYEYTLNVIFNMQRGAGPDSSTYGNVFSQISLRGSPAVKLLVSEFRALAPPDRGTFNIDQLIAAMQQHLSQLETDPG